MFSNCATYALYNAKKQFIRSVSSSSASLEIVEDEVLPLDANVAYIRFSTEYQAGYSVYVKSGNFNDMAIGEKAVDNTMLDLKAVELGNIGESVITHDEQTNFVNLTGIKSGYYIDASGAEHSATGFNVTDFIPLEENKKYYEREILYTYFAFYDSNKTLIQSYATFGNLTNPWFTTPQNTANWGLGGYTSVQWWNEKQSADFSGFDSAIINLGINDAINSVPIANTESALRSIIGALKSANNGIKIFLATVVPAYTDGSTTYDDVNDLIKSLAEELTDCYLVDLSRYSHASKGSAYEAGHLTAIGYRMLAQDYAGYIGYIIRTNLTAFKWIQFIGTNYSKS